VEGQALLLVVWVAAWWLAVRAVFGRLLGAFEWLVVAIVAWGVPVTLADLAATSAGQVPESVLVVAWGGVAILIDAVWLARRSTRHLPGDNPQQRPQTSGRDKGFRLDIP